MCQTIDPKWVKECPFRSVLLSWRTGLGKRRHIVGEVMITDNGEVSFSYAANLDSAKAEGFSGYPGLPLAETINQTTAIDLFLRRLINTEREDALKKLSFWGVTKEQLSNKLYLLGVTQGRSTSDEFEFLPILEQKDSPYRFITDIAGLGFYATDISSMKVGDFLDLKKEPENRFDANAVSVNLKGGEKIGYLKQGINQLFSQLGSAKAEIIRIINTEHIKQVFISCEVPPQK